MRLLSILIVGGLSISAGAHAETVEHNGPVLSVSFSSLRANAGPGQCGCFYIQGGSAEFVEHFNTYFSAVADLGGQTGSRLDGTANGLSLITYTAGPRLSLGRHNRFNPFVQILGGGTHAFNTYIPTTQPTNSSNGFAMLAGGGLGVRLSHHVALQPVQIDYLLSGIPNGSSNKQSNLRLSAGVALGFR